MDIISIENENKDYYAATTYHWVIADDVVITKGYSDPMSYLQDALYNNDKSYLIELSGIKWYSKGD